MEREESDLYGLPLDEFIPARTELERRVRREGDRERAAAVKRLPKPTVAAWGVNQASRSQPQARRELLAAAAELREVHDRLIAGDASAADLEAAAARQRSAIDALTDAAAGLLSSEGESLSDATLARIRDTFGAVAADPELAELVEAGTLDRERRAAGLGFGGLALPEDEAEGGEARARDRAKAGAKGGVKDAKGGAKAGAKGAKAGAKGGGGRARGEAEAAEHARAARDARAAREDARAARARAKAARAEARATAKRLAGAERAAEAAAAALTGAEREATKAAEALAKAERRLEKARGRAESAREDLEAARAAHRRASATDDAAQKARDRAEEALGRHR